MRIEHERSWKGTAALDAAPVQGKETAALDAELTGELRFKHRLKEESESGDAST